ncbi:ABC transporter ATP-binding protein [Treponema sp. HNW]|uniref:ABC transporter ATP-binding protein n=1 Tax=Treponema sp. HNW TaxID=3116654 RepID=UPI003D134947
MNEKELKKQVTGKNFLPNLLLTLKIVFDLIPQVLLVLMISKLFSKEITQPHFKMFITGMLISFILKAVFNYLATKTAHDRAFGKLTELRLAIIDHLKKLNLGFFKKHNTGELTSIIEHDVEQVEIYLAHGLPEIMSASLLPTLVFIAMLFIDYRLALIMIAGVPLMFLVKQLSAEKMQKRFQMYFSREMKMREDMMEYVKNISVIKAFAKEESFSGQTLASARSYVQDVKKSMGAVTGPMVLIDIFMEAGTVAVMILGSILLLHQNISTAQFILPVILSSVFVSAISKTATLHHFSIVFTEKIKSIAKILCAPLSKEKISEQLKPGDIEFTNVNFKYEKDGFALQDINLKFTETGLNALVGPSGCGKSTLANLIMGFWDVDSGLLTISGKDISRYDTDSISTLIGSVQQEVILFNMSIFENIAIGKAGASESEVIEAAKKARCHDFISALPRGYNTKVGEMGVKLSGGEKQRISIARMILKNAPILILDEAMAAVDSENEKLINEAVEELRKNKTVITIAHHLNTIRNADQIVVMDKGRILDSGTHTELINRCPFYKEMTDAQNKVDSWNVAG